MNPLCHILSQLKSSSRHVIVNGNIGELSELQQYLHIARPPEEKLRQTIESCKGAAEGRLILLCGNVGDGKSHLLSHLGQEKALGDFELHNDATESFDPSKTNLETLITTVLREFSDSNVEETRRKLILAINLGVVANFLDIAADSGYSRLKDYIDKSHILEVNASREVESARFAHVDFTADPPVVFTAKGAKAPVFDAILDKIFLAEDRNPFFCAYKASLETKPNTVACINYGFLLDADNRQAFSQLLVQAVVKNKVVFSVRELLDFLAEALLQYGGDLPSGLSGCFDRYLPYSIFESGESALHSAFHRNDPTRIRNHEADDGMFQLAAVTSANQRINIGFKDEVPEWVSQRIPREVDELPAMRTLCKLKRRIAFFRSGGKRQSDDAEYTQFLETLHSVEEFLRDNTQHFGVQKFIEMLTRACECWHGDSHAAHHIVIQAPSHKSKFRLLREFELDVVANQPDCVALKPNEFSILLHLNKIVIQRLHVDFELFRMIHKVSHGYLPNRYDQQSCVALSAFVATLINAGVDSSKVLVDRINAGGVVDYEATQSGFGVTFSRVKK